MRKEDSWPPVEWLQEPATDTSAEEYSRWVNDPTLVIQDGDVVWRFSSPRESWMYLAGRAGLALVRDGQIVHSFTRILS